MQYIHQTHYGHAGAFHTAKPVFAMDKGQMYEMKNGRPDTKAVYSVRDNKVYATAFHPNGGSPHAMFEIKGDKVHTTTAHPAHNADRHVFEIKGMMT